MVLHSSVGGALQCEHRFEPMAFEAMGTNPVEAPKIFFWGFISPLLKLQLQL